MKQIISKTYNVTNDIVGKITFNRHLLFNRSNHILVGEHLTCTKKGFAASITTIDNLKETDKAICVVENISEFNEGDIVSIDSSGSIKFLYEIQSRHNAVFVTEKCNHRCIMCPQPPVVDEVDKTALNLKIISLFDKQTTNIGITGGEPTMVGDKLFELGKGLLKHDQPLDEIWQMTTKLENAWIEQIDKSTYCRVGDIFKVRVGIKTCADNVFLNSTWESEQNIPEEVLLRNLISQENIKSWHIDHNTCTKVLYPYYALEGKKEVFDIELYPRAKAYLEKHKQQLHSRKYLIDAGRKWYEMWVPQNPAYFDLPKLVFPDISLTPRFTFDSSKSIVNGNCYWIPAKNEEEEYLLLLIEGVSNSKTMTKYHDLKFNNKLYSGRRRYLAQYIEKYPIPHPHTKITDEIVDLVKKLNACPSIEIQLVNKLDELVNQAFNLQ